MLLYFGGVLNMPCRYLLDREFVVEPLPEDFEGVYSTRYVAYAWVGVNVSVVNHRYSVQVCTVQVCVSMT